MMAARRGPWLLLACACAPLFGCEVLLGIDDRVAYVGPPAETPKDPCLLTVIGSYRDNVLADEPALYWRLDETAGATQAADETGELPGVVQGEAFVAGAQQGAFAESAGAAHFDGTTVIFTETGQLPFGGDAAWTVELWTKPEGVVDGETGSTQRVVLGKYDYCAACPQSCDSAACQAGFLMDLGGDPSELRFIRVAPDEPWAAVATDHPAVHSWHHVVAIYDPSGAYQLQLYVDGRRFRSSWPVPTPVANEAPFVVGSRSVSANPSFYRGDIDEVAAYDHALGEEAVQRHYCAALRK